MLHYLLGRTGVVKALFWFLLGCAPWAIGSELASPPVAFARATTLWQLLDLAPTCENTLLPVRLEGVVCWIDPTRTLLVLQEGSRIAFLTVDLPKDAVVAGDRVLIEGPCLVEDSKFNFRCPPVVDNDGMHGLLEKQGTLFLKAGKHRLKLLWFNNSGASGLEVGYAGPDLSRQAIPQDALCRPVVDSASGATNWVQGLEYRAYEGGWDRLPDFAHLEPVREGAVTGFDLSACTRTTNAALMFTGYLEVPRDGSYTFFLTSDDGSRFSLDEATAQFTVTGTNAFPQPRPVVPGQGFLHQERQWCEVEGQASFAYERPQGLMIEVSAAQGRMLAALPVSSHLSATLLRDTQLRLRGVCQSLYSPGGEPIAGRLLVPSLEAIEVLSVPARRWSAYPATPIPRGSTAFLDPNAETVLHVCGRISAVQSSRNFLLSDGTNSVAVETVQPLAVGVGAEIEVLGRWQRLAATNPVLVCAVWREANAGSGHDSGGLPCLTTMEQVHGLSRTEAQRHYPVHVRGVVTYARLGTADGVLQDATRGVYVQGLAPQGYIPLDIGDYLEVEGETVPGDFAPMINATRVTSLGRAQLPDPVHPTWDQLMSGSVDCQYVELDGIITSAQDPLLQLLRPEGPLRVEVVDYEFPELARCENAHVHLRGCLLAKWDPDTCRVISGTLQLRGVTEYVEEAAPKDLLASPSKRIPELKQFDPRAGALQRVRTSGQVLHSRNGVYFLTDGTNGMRFLLKRPASLQTGDQVELAGYPDVEGPSPLLRDAVVRKTGHGSLPLPKPLKPEDLLRASNDGTLVEIDGRLVSFGSSGTEQLLEFQSGSRTFLARMNTKSGRVKPIRIGSTVRLRGVYTAQGPGRVTGQDNESFELLLISPADLRVLAQPPWWTPQRAIVATGGLAAVLVLAFTWIFALRRQVGHSTRELRAEIEERKQTEAKLSAEIIERKRMEEQVEKAHRELVIASRQAGMADVATSVLHNVGNVLNSANVSTSLLMQQVKGSKVSNLAKIADWIRGREETFPEFVQRDPRGQHLPRYLVQLADHLGAEKERTLGELRGLAKNIEHIKEIVAMQQSYACVTGVQERVRLQELIEDALRMTETALERHRITLKREYDDSVPETTVDRHKVLQILVNLLQNAKQACSASNRPDSELSVSLARHEGRARIVVSDNGVGIAPENLTRIYNYGFTTRKDGHGFGLHSSALAAKELGGTLTAQSDGPGKGATFMLELPLV